MVLFSKKSQSSARIRTSLRELWLPPDPSPVPKFYFFSDPGQKKASRSFLLATIFIQHCDTPLFFQFSYWFRLLLIMKFKNLEKILKSSSWNQKIFYQEKSSISTRLLTKSGGLVRLVLGMRGCMRKMLHCQKRPKGFPVTKTETLFYRAEIFL
jgi:hypothetical protein